MFVLGEERPTADDHVKHIFVGGGAEEFWIDEGQEGQKLGQVVLKRRSCHQQPEGRPHLHEVLVDLRFGILHGVGLVKDQGLKLHLLYEFSVNRIGGDEVVG